MPLLRVTMQGLALVINRPTASIVVFPSLKHKFRVVGPFADKQTEVFPADIRLGDANGKPLPDKATLRASSKYVAHLDHITGRAVELPDELTGAKLQDGLNARFFLTGGQLTGLPASSHKGLLRDVVWTFTEDKYQHRQKLTDTIIFSVELDARDYTLVLSGSKRVTLPLNFGKAQVIDLTLDNDDECPDPGLPKFQLKEPSTIFEIAGLKDFTPTIIGERSSGVRRGDKDKQDSKPKVEKKGENPTGSVCDDVCTGFQAEG